MPIVHRINPPIAPQSPKRNTSGVNAVAGIAAAMRDFTPQRSNRYPKPKEAQELVGTYTFVADDRVKVEYKGRDPYIVQVAIVADEMTLTFADGRTGKYKRLP